MTKENNLKNMCMPVEITADTLANYKLQAMYISMFTDAGVAHTCASLLRDNGEAVFALAFGHGGEGGVLLVKLPVAGSAVTTLLKRESTVPRFLSGITGALR